MFKKLHAINLTVFKNVYIYIYCILDAITGLGINSNSGIGYLL